MARLRTLAYAMKGRIEEIPELAGQVVVYRRADIESQFESRMGKVSGRCVVIQLVNATNEGNRDTSQFAATYNVSLWSVPLLNVRDAVKLDDLTAAIEDKINGWWPVDIPGNTRMCMRTVDLKFPEAAQYDVSALTFKTPIIPLVQPPNQTRWEVLDEVWETIDETWEEIR